MDSIGFVLRDEARMRVLTEEVLRTSEIEGEHLNADAVRSSIARRLGINIGALAPTDRHVEGVVDMVVDATNGYKKELTAERLFGWHAALFPKGYSGSYKIKIADWRDDLAGPMQIVSGELGREKVHYEAPPAKRLPREMKQFLTWANHKKTAALDPVLVAGRAHLWFVTIHPFDDGNGRIARALGDLFLARADDSKNRFYSLSAQIQRERKDYYDLLERVQQNSLDDTEWQLWFLGCLARAIDGAEKIISKVLAKSHFWNDWKHVALNKRQTDTLNLLLDSFEGKMTSSKWAKLSKCSSDTALRDIQELLAHGILKKESAGGRSTSYVIGTY